MYEIKKKKRFEAAHYIKGHTAPDGSPGKCSRPHGHSYTVAVCIRSQTLLPIGFVIDFYHVGAALGGITDEWDHQDLNSLPYIKANQINTTAENLAEIAFGVVGNLLAKLKKSGEAPDNAFVWYAEICETEGTETRYYNPERLQGI